MKGFIAALLWLYTSQTFANEPPHCEQTCQRQQINNYFVALDTIYRQHSTVQDINELFSLLHPSAGYQHIEYQAEFDNSQWRQAFTANLERGAYSKPATAQTKVLNAIHGYNTVAVEYAYGDVTEADNWQQSGQGLLILFRFEDGLIKHIAEYWLE